MNALGYIVYAVLIFIAITWTVGVRVKLDAGIHTIFGALFFLTSAIVVGVSGVSKLHSLWLIPSGFILVIISSTFAIHIPPLFYLIRLISSAFVIIVRIGIPASKIKAIQNADTKAMVEKFVSQMNSEDK